MTLHYEDRGRTADGIAYGKAGHGPALVCVGAQLPLTPGLARLAENRTLWVTATPPDEQHLTSFIEDTVGGPCDLLGQGHGTRLALAIAAQAPQLVARLVLPSPSHFSMHGKGNDWSDDDEMLERLGDIRAETLILVGTKDDSAPPSLATLLKSRIPKAQLSYIYDAGRDLDVDQPERFARLVTSYLDLGPAFIVKRTAAG